MTKSKLTDFTILAATTYGRRTVPVSKITVHHMASTWSAEDCGKSFANPARNASSNYGIDSDGVIACYVPEETAACTSSSYWNDNQAITIEVANSSMGGDWPVSDKAWKSLVKLCADICKRYNITPSYNGTANATFTEHRMFVATACPGPYLHTRMNKLIKEVKLEIAGAEQKPGKPVNNVGMHYRTHVQNLGWLAPVHDGQTSGTVGASLRVEAIKMTPPEGVTLTVNVHIQNKGWLTYEGVKRGGNDPVMGTEGESKRLEAVQIHCTENSTGKNIRYRAHVQGKGWLGWCNDGDIAGTTGQSLRLEAIQIEFV